MTNGDGDRDIYTVRTRRGYQLRERPQSAHESGINNKAQDIASHSSRSVGKLRNQTVYRQNSNSISTDTSGAAIQTINNILNGITESVNRLTELQYRMPDCTGSGKIHTVKVDNLPQNKISKNIPEASQAPKPPIVKIKALRQRIKALSSKLSTINSSWSNCSLKKKSKMSGKLNERKNQREKQAERIHPEMAEPVTAAPVKKKLKPYTKPHVDRHYSIAAPSIKPFEFSPHKLVEIYHNNAAKESDSEEEKNKSKIQVKIKSDAIPNLNINSHDCGDCKDIKNCNHANDEGYEEPHAPRICYTNKSYELPTIASKMKQAVKLDFNMFNFKAIPFCPVSSTTPSHNIGINIQQVMSIIKTRQPVQGISPTLAHNINLAAEKLNHDPLTSFVSSMTSKICYGRSTCPLNKYSLNYRHLEEMARNVPEEIIEECEENAKAGPSGDMQTRSPPGPNQWTTDNKRTCTCTPANGVDFNQVYNKYRTNPSPYDHKNHVTRHYPSTAEQSYRKVSSRKIRSMGYADESYNNQNAAVFIQDKIISPMNGREKNLKEVLMNLHDDFEAMNKKYETLSIQIASGDTNQDAIDELEDLEQQLNKKEEEINIVMSLYKEVMALKQEVKELKKYNTENNVTRQPRPEDYSSKTAQHISKLLQQIQHYHTYYRNGQNAYNM